MIPAKFQSLTKIKWEIFTHLLYKEIRCLDPYMKRQGSTK